MIEHQIATEEQQQAYFEQALQRTTEAMAATDSRSATLCVGGTIVRLLFAGGSLWEQLLPALEHLRVDAQLAPEATFHLWDSESTGIEMVPPPCKHECFTNRGDIWGFQSPRYRLAFQWSEFSVNLLDVQTGTGIFWVRSARSLPYWVNASPLRTLFHWWMQKNGRHLLHAAAVATPDGGVLITGRGGVGKSTSALSCLHAGLQYLADDYCIVGLEPEPTVYCLYNTAKLNRDQMSKFPQLAGLVSNDDKPDDEKSVIFLYPEKSEQIRLQAPINWILTPRITNGRSTTISPIPPHCLLRSAEFTTLSQLPHAGRRLREIIENVVHGVHGAELTLGTDLAQIPQVIAGLLEDPVAARNRLSGSPAVVTRAQPMVSVIIPVFNGASFIAEAIECVLSQNYSALEIIVVNDGSTDNTASVLQEFASHVSYFEQENAGPSAARNRGVREALGEFIAFLDVDDLWPENNLQRMIGELDSDPNLEVLHGHGQVMQLDPQTGCYEFVGNPEESFPYYIGAGLYRRSAFEKVGLFDTALDFSEDTDWYLRAKEAKLNLRRLPEVTLFVRRHQQNMTRGKSLAELTPLRLVKNYIDRNRQAAD